MQYQLRVLRDGQPPYQFAVEASTIEDARNKAEQQGLTVLQVKSQAATFGLKLLSPQTAAITNAVVVRLANDQSQAIEGK